MNSVRNDMGKSIIKIQTVVILVCFMTVISQMPVFVNHGLASTISSVSWMMLMVLCLSRQISFDKSLGFPLVTSSIVFAFWMIAGIFDSSYSNSAIIRQVMLSMFVIIVGSLCGRFLDKRTYERIFMGYIWAALFVAINIYFEYLAGRSFTTLTYAYASKNSISQIVLTAIILIIVGRLTSGKIIFRMIYGIMLVFFVYTLLALKSRACLVMLPIIVIVLLSKVNFNKNLKRLILLILCVITLVFMFNDTVVDVVINQVLFVNRKHVDLNSLSSGRFSQWEGFWKDFMEYPFFGHGGRHRESLVLTSYLEYGFLFGTLILLVALYPIWWCVKCLSKEDDFYITTLLISICYASNGIFEMLAPFGPGTKCFMVWFLIGSLSSYRFKKGYKRENRKDDFS